MSPRRGSHGGGDRSAAGAGLDERQRRILGALVHAYIDQGEPVSSLWLAERGSFGVSSATLRHALVHLEELGYVHQPHTSAGRVPTDLGYRCYVDRLLSGRRLARAAPDVEARLRQAGTVEDLLEGASRELSRASHHLGFALALDEPTAFEHVEFVPLDPSRVLVVVVVTGGRISHKVVEVDETLRPSDLQQAANYLNTEFAGLPLPDVRAAILRRLDEERTLYDALAARALRLAQRSVDDLVPQTTIVVQGASSLLDLETVEAIGRPALETLRALLKMIEEKHRLVRLLSEYLDGPGLTIVIGSEHVVPDLQPFSLVASTWGDRSPTGAIGVIGPLRMRYSKAIAAVDSLSRAMGRALGTV